MKILFSPSEKKTILSPYHAKLEDSLSFKELFDKREYVLKIYNEIIQSGDNAKIAKLFGLKETNIDDKIKAPIEPLCDLQEAILRYTGVAYDHLSYETLPKDSQKFIKDNLIIFSNLFGPLYAKDKIPLYKFKQSEKLDGFAPEKHYKEHFSPLLDELLKDELIIDLRAGFYEKFYTIPYPYITCKFLKNGKAVSHWAKAYRGKVVRALSVHQPQNEKEFASINIEGLHVKEIQETKLKKEYVFEIS